MDRVNVYLIFWEPTGKAPAATYNSTIIQFFKDIVYGQLNGGTPYHDMLTQYYSVGNGRQLHVTSVFNFGGAVLDTSAYASDAAPSDVGVLPCTAGSFAPGAGHCLSDADISYKAHAAAVTQHWTEDVHSLFLVFTGKDAIVCSNFAAFGSGCSPTSTSDQADATCGYHSSNFPAFNRIYGAVAYPISRCLLTATKVPNQLDTDSAISAGSHELFEGITDPTGAGWCGSAGYHTFAGPTAPFGNICQSAEIGDQCQFQHFTAFGTLDGSGGDLLLNGDDYLVQSEWSNRAPLSPSFTDESGASHAIPNKCVLS
ncbi:MAG: hypothetical protein ACYDGR_10765 [Candidatus Dormibacteria bacterium]